MIPEIDEQPVANLTLKKFYTPQMIRFGTFLGGPIVAGYLISTNYKSFNQYQKSVNTWLYAILATVVLFAVVIFIPDSGNNNGSFKFIIPLMYSWATFALVNYLQTGLITQHTAAGGVNYGWGRVILIGLIGCAVTLAAIIILVAEATILFPSLQTAGSN